MDLVLRRPALPFFLLPGLFLLPLTGCHESYSPNTYSSDAAQQAAPVQRGVIIGVRQVLISSSGATGATAGAAAGGIAGAQLPTSALGAVGGALVGTLGGAAAEKVIADSKGWEYIVQESNNNLISVTQTDKIPFPIGTHVLVIDGSKQARIVQDYTEQLPAKPAASAKTAGKVAPANLIAASAAQPGVAAKEPSAPAAVAAPATPAAAPTGAATTPAATASATPAAPTGTVTTTTTSTQSITAPAQAASGATSSTSPSDASATAAPAIPSLPTSVTNDLMLLQGQSSTSTNSSGGSSTTATDTTAPTSTGGSPSSSSTTTSQTSGY